MPSSVGAEHIDCAIFYRNNAAGLVRMKEATAGGGCAFVSEDGDIGAGSMDIKVAECVTTIAHGLSLAAIIGELGEVATLCYRLQTARRVIKSSSCGA